MGCAVLFDDKGKAEGFICGKSIKPCHFCGAMTDYLCDYPIGNSKTCDLPLCDKHANKSGGDVDFCPIHYAQFKGKPEVGERTNIHRIRG